MRGIFTLSKISPLDGELAASDTVAAPTRSLRKLIAARVLPAFRRAPRSNAYSVDKLLALQQYVECTSRWRVAAVLLATPIPGLVGALFLSVVPLQSPLDPVRANPGYLVNCFLVCFLVHLGTMVHWRAASALPASSYSWHQLVLVCTIGASAHWLIVTAISFLWRFPVPMSWIVSGSTIAFASALGHVLVLRERCWRDTQFINGMRRYAPALLFQCFQVVLYPAFSVLFDNVSPSFQVLLTLAFPLVKYFMKIGLRRYTRDLEDLSNEVAVTGIEICASLYQSMILQNAPSQVALIVIIALDVLQGLVAVKFFMDQSLLVSRNQVVGLTLNIRSGACDGDRIDGRQVLGHIPTEGANQSLPSAISANAPRSESKPIPDCSVVEHTPHVRDPECHTVDAKATLQLVGIAETILLVEYLEVAIPLLNTLFVAVSCQFNAAMYNPRLRKLYFHPEARPAALQSMAFYSLLQALSFLAMHMVMRHRYGLSAVYQLAFILELHWQSIVGKMIAWLPIILHFTGIHYGVDFSFRFDYAAMLQTYQP